VKKATNQKRYAKEGDADKFIKITRKSKKPIYQRSEPDAMLK